MDPGSARRTCAPSAATTIEAAEKRWRPFALRVCSPPLLLRSELARLSARRDNERQSSNQSRRELKGVWLAPAIGILDQGQKHDSIVARDGKSRRVPKVGLSNVRPERLRGPHDRGRAFPNDAGTKPDEKGGIAIYVAAEKPEGAPRKTGC